MWKEFFAESSTKVLTFRQKYANIKKLLPSEERAVNSTQLGRKRKEKNPNMMRKHITRTLTRTTVPVYTVDMVNGKAELSPLEPVVIFGRPTERQISKAVKDAYGENSVVAGKPESVDVAYRISIEDFVAAAEVVELNSDTDEENEEENGGNY